MGSSLVQRPSSVLFEVSGKRIVGQKQAGVGQIIQIVVFDHGTRVMTHAVGFLPVAVWFFNQTVVFAVGFQLVSFPNLKFFGIQIRDIGPCAMRQLIFTTRCARGTSEGYRGVGRDRRARRSTCAVFFEGIQDQQEKGSARALRHFN